jgi:toxin ParE1/3/4
MKRATFAPAAEADLEAIYDYIAADNAVAAAKLVARLEELAARLAETPGMGRARAELLPDLRSFPLANYVVFYRPIESGIEIVRVLHGARDVPVIFGIARE